VALVPATDAHTIAAARGRRGTVHAFVISESTDWRQSLTRALRRAGHAVAGTSDADHATAGIRRSSTAPDLVIVDAGGDAAPLTRLIERVRGAVEDEQLPIVAVLPEHSSWRRKTPPRDLQPLIVVATTASVSELVHAAVTHAADGAPAGVALAFDDVRREATGPRGTTRVTPFEARILAAMIRDHPRPARRDHASALGRGVRRSPWPCRDPLARALAASEVACDRA